MQVDRPSQIHRLNRPKSRSREQQPLREHPNATGCSQQRVIFK